MGPADEDALLNALTELKANSKLFDKQALQALWRGGYTSCEILRSATRRGLERANLKPGMVDYLLGLLGGFAIWVLR